MNTKTYIKKSFFKQLVTFIIKISVLTILVTILPSCGGSGGGEIPVQEIEAPPPESSSETSALLTWDAPTTNTDDSCITDHGGYNVYYGEDSSNMVSLIRNVDTTCTDTEVDAGTDCGNVYQCTYTVFSLTTGTWYFAVTSEDLAGNESEASNIANKMIN